MIPPGSENPHSGLESENLGDVDVSDDDYDNDNVDANLRDLIGSCHTELPARFLPFDR